MRHHVAQFQSWLARQGAEKPFARLVEHFVSRSLRGGGESDSDELNLSTGLLLMLLPIPGTFVSLIYYEKYSTFLQILRKDLIADPYSASLGDEYLFIVVSMVLTGILAVWRWDGVLLDRRDFANLVHLPVAPSRLFLSNLVAILFVTMLFTFEVNIGSSVLFPIVVSSSYPDLSVYAGFAFGHAAAVGLASVFTFVAVVALVGLSMFLFPYWIFRRISQYLRIALIVFLLFLLLTTFLIGPLTSQLAHAPTSFLRFLPPVWFLGLCENLRHSAAPAFHQLARIACFALGSAATLALIGCSLSYRRCFLSVPETVEPISSKSSLLLTLLLRFANRWYVRTPASRACFGFAVRTLTRSEKHFTALGAFAGLSLLLCVQTLLPLAHHGAGNNGSIPSSPILSLPLIVIYCLVVGMRFAFEIPADLRSNWIFRTQLDANLGESGRALLWTMIAPFLLFVCVPAYAYLDGWGIAAIHLLFLTTMAALLIETMILRLRKIPFTCSVPIFKENAFVTIFLLFIGFYLFVRVGSFLEYVTLMDPVRVILLVSVLGGWWLAVRQFRSNLLDMDRAIIFEEKPVEAVQVLGLHTTR